MKIGVIGAGTMGQGIAKAFAQVEGNTVALCDIKQEWAENGLAKIKKGYEKLVAKGKMTQEKADAIVAAITPGLKENLCADCDLVVEAAFEDMKVKQTTFGELDKICKPECVFASNTSSLSLTEIGKGLSRPLIGMHFFNPADRMKLIEVIAGCNTPAETVEKIKEISVAIGKSPVQVNEAAGFVVNRILIPMINEAAFIKMEGVSDIAGIDTAMKLGANHPMGPLELGDFIGLDICLAIMDVLYNACMDGNEGLDLCLTEPFDLILLDLNLPGMDGLSILQQLRAENSSTPVIILSARTQIQDKVEGLDLGANDYLTKPFHFEELEARIRSLTRRKFIQENICLKCGRITFDTRTRKAAIDSEELSLTRKETALLEYFMLHQNRIISPEELIEHIWDGSVNSFSNSIRVHISALRKKLRTALGNDPIQNKIGQGYILTEDLK